MRKLATLREVSEIKPIEGADMIELALVDGWQCVVKKGEFCRGAIGVYFEIDSFLDHTRPEFAFLAPRAIKWNGKEGARIKSMKLKGQLSQGLLLPTSAFVPRDDAGNQIGESLDDWIGMSIAIDGDTVDSLNERMDLDTFLGVEKWEKLLPANLAGTARGNFPTFIFKTDQERVQNLPRVFDEYGDSLFQVTQKLDGSSMTAYVVSRESNFYVPTDDDLQSEVHMPNQGVCSRNLDLVKVNGNAFWDVACRDDIHNKILRLMEVTRRPALAIQGELIGKGIQDNHEKCEGENEFYVFDIFDIDAQRYLSPFTTAILCQDVGLNHVPIIHDSIKLKDYAEDRGHIIEKAAGPSLRTKTGEGKVFKLISETDGFSFKAISNEYLLKTGN